MKSRESIIPAYLLADKHSFIFIEFETEDFKEMHDEVFIMQNSCRSALARNQLDITDRWINMRAIGFPSYRSAIGNEPTKRWLLSFVVSSNSIIPCCKH